MIGDLKPQAMRAYKIKYGSLIEATSEQEVADLKAACAATGADPDKIIIQPSKEDYGILAADSDE